MDQKAKVGFSLRWYVAVPAGPNVASSLCISCVSARAIRRVTPAFEFD